MLQPMVGGGLTPLAAQGRVVELTPLAALGTDPSATSPTAPAPLVAMAPPVLAPTPTLVAMEAVQPAAGPLVAMETKAPLQVALVPMEEQPGQEAPLQVAEGFGRVVGPVPAAESRGGFAMVAAGDVPNLPPLGVAQVIASTLEARRDGVIRGAAPGGVGAEVVVELIVNDDLLSPGVFAYRGANPNDLLLPLGEVARVLGLGLTVDPTTGTVRGWLSNTEQTIELNTALGELKVGKQRLALQTGQVALAGDEIYLSADLLARLLGGTAEVSFRYLQANLTTTVPVPVAAARARAKAWALATAQRQAPDLMAEAKILDYPFATLPTIGLDYGGTWQSQSATPYADSLGIQLDGTFFYSAASAGLGLVRDERDGLRLTGGNLRLVREEVSPTLLAEWLGPFAARRLEAGDIGATAVPLSTLTASGRGIRLSNAPAGQIDDPERFVLEGDAPAGWDVEVYQNRGLLAFQRASAAGRYSFATLPLRPGLNEFKIVLYGPRGEQETRTARYVLGDAMLAKGQLTYDVSLYEPSTPVFSFSESNQEANSQATLAQRYAYGLTSNLTAVVAAYSGLGGSSTTIRAPANAVAAGLRGTLLETYWQADTLAADDKTRRVAALLARQLPLDIGARLAYQRTWGSSSLNTLNEAQWDVELSRVLKIGDYAIDNALGYRRTIPENGPLTEAVQLRTGLALKGVALSNEFEGRWSQGGGDVQTQGEAVMSTQALGGSVQVGLDYRPSDPESIWQQAVASYRTQLTENMDGDLRLSQNLRQSGQTSLEGGLTYQFDKVALGVRANQSKNSGLGLGLTLGTQLRPQAGGYAVTNPRRSGATSGNAQVKLFAFIDENGNGVADTGEPPLPGVVFTNLNRNSVQTTNQVGEAVFTDIPASTPVRVAVDGERLPDIYLRLPKRPLVVFGQSGTRGEYAIPLARVGEVNGTVWQAGRDGRRVGVASLWIEAVDEAGRRVARTRTGSDGFYVLGDLPIGRYMIQIAPAEANKAGFHQSVPIPVTLTTKHYLVDGMDVVIESLSL